MLVAGVVVLLIAVGVGAYLGFSGGSSTSKASGATPTTGHLFFAPECAPVRGTRWVYPGPTKIASDRYESFAIRVSCAKAADWTRRLAQLTVPVKKHGVASILKGPRGFDCEAWPDAQGHAYAGGCQKGDNVAFGWNWNVENPRQALAQIDGQYHVVSLGGADLETVLTALPHRHYRLKVLNTSGIGYVNGFNWTPPPGSRITSITSSSGATCKLRSATLVTCAGKVSPPSCLCKGDGGAVTIEVAFAAPISGGHGTGGARVAITAMTPLPYLIPGTPKAAKRQHGV